MFGRFYKSMGQRYGWVKIKQGAALERRFKGGKRMREQTCQKVKSTSPEAPPSVKVEEK